MTASAWPPIDRRAGIPRIPLLGRWAEDTWLAVDVSLIKTAQFENESSLQRMCALGRRGSDLRCRCSRHHACWGHRQVRNIVGAVLLGLLVVSACIE